MKKYIFFVLGVLFIAGCQDSINPPTWYYNTQNDARYLYGVGSAKDLQLAKDNALDDMLSHIQVSINSNTSISQAYKNGIESSDIQQHIQKHIAQTTFNNVSYQTHYANDTYFVRAKVAIQDFITQLQKQQKKSLNIIQSLNLQCQDIALKEYNILSQEFKKLLSTQNYLDSLNVPTKDTLLYASMLESNAPKPKVMLVFENPNQKGARELKQHIQKELVKFYRLSTESTQKIIVRFEMPNPTNAKVSITIIDCNNNPTFVTQLEETLPGNIDVDKLASRIGVLLYKKLSYYADNE